LINLDVSRTYHVPNVHYANFVNEGLTAVLNPQCRSLAGAIEPPLVSVRRRAVYGKPRLPAQPRTRTIDGVANLGHRFNRRRANPASPLNRDAEQPATRHSSV
jgi:hypothetical protein